MKTSDEPLHLFLTGGAGVGKTVVVNATYQAMLRFYNKDLNTDLNDAKILLAAPTGTAALLIRGNKLHTQDTGQPKTDLQTSYKLQTQHIKLPVSMCEATDH